MRSIAAPVLLSSTLLLTGCVGLPSGWKFWGTPLTKLESKEQDVSAAQLQATRAAQELIHKTTVALSHAPASRPVEVASSFAQEARTILDHAVGAPSVGDSAEWRGLVERLLSENAEIRAKAERERAKDSERLAELSDELTEVRGERDKLQDHVADYAKDNERLADIVRKFQWFAIGIGVLWAVSQLLTVAARINPAFAPFAGVFNAVAAPALARAQARAVEGLQSVGRGIAEARKMGDTAVERIVAFIDEKADREHKAVIAKGAGNPFND